MIWAIGILPFQNSPKLVVCCWMSSRSRPMPTLCRRQHRGAARELIKQGMHDTTTRDSIFRCWHSAPWYFPDPPEPWRISTGLVGPFLFEMIPLKDIGHRRAAQFQFVTFHRATFCKAKCPEHFAFRVGKRSWGYFFFLLLMWDVWEGWVPQTPKG